MRRSLLSIVAMIVIILSHVSCNRKPLEDPYKYLAYIPITTDWSLSQLDEESMTNISIYFYSEGATEPTLKISDDIHFNVVQLPIGVYSILIMNEMVGDVYNVNHYDENTYDYVSANAIADLTSSPTYYTMSSTERLLKHHDRVAVWSLDEFVIDEDMVEYTRTDEFGDYIEEARSKSAVSRSEDSDGSEGGEELLSLLSSLTTPTTELVSKSIESLTWIQPLPITTIVNISARVLNLNNAMYIEAVLKGTASGSLLHNDTPTWPVGETNIYNFFITDRSYDNPTDGIDGQIDYTLNTFGRTFDDESYVVELMIILQSGELMSFQYDVTNQVKKYDGKEIYIDLSSIDGGDGDDDGDGSDSGGSTPIELPEFGITGFDVNPWGDVVVVPL